MYRRVVLIVSLFVLLFTVAPGCRSALDLLDKNGKVTVSFAWPVSSATDSRLIPPDATAMFLSICSVEMTDFRRTELVTRTQGSNSETAAFSWDVFPGAYRLCVIAAKNIGQTSAGKTIYSGLTVGFSEFVVQPDEEKNVCITLDSFACSGTITNRDSFTVSGNLTIGMTTNNLRNFLKFSGGKVYFSYNNGHSTMTSNKSILVSNTVYDGNGEFAATVLPGKEGYPAREMTIQFDAKFTVNRDAVADGFFDTYAIEEIRFDILKADLGQLSDHGSGGTIGCTVQ